MSRVEPMKYWERCKVVERYARELRRIAWSGVFDGTGKTEGYLQRCIRRNMRAGLTVTYTRDVMHHLSGWWRNPEYERAFHLSVSFFEPDLGDHPIRRDPRLTKLALEAFFGKDSDKVWSEPPYTDDAKRRDVWHYRLFCDPAWEGIIPHGEVYSKLLTEGGWKSFSEVQAALQAEAELETAKLLDPPKRRIV